MKSITPLNTSSFLIVGIVSLIRCGHACAYTCTCTYMCVCVFSFNLSSKMSYVKSFE